MTNPCLLSFYILNDELKNTCDFNPELLINASGVYEVFRVIGGKPLFLNEHLDRFSRSVKALGISNVYSKEQIRNKIRTLIESNSLKLGNIQFQYLENNAKQVNFLAWIPPFYYPGTKLIEEGAEVISFSATREKPQIKRTNLPARLQADEIKKESGIHEVILVNHDELITEGSRSNIFFIKNKQLFTPELSLVLPGITQSKIFEVALENNIEIIKTQIKIEDATNFDAAFISSTSNKVLPLKKLDDFEFDAKNKIVETIRLGFEQLTQENLKKFSW